MREHVRTYWWVWLLVAVVVIAANEAFDRVFFNEAHWDADIFLAVVVAALAAIGSYLVARRRSV